MEGYMLGRVRGEEVQWGRSKGGVSMNNSCMSYTLLAISLFEFFFWKSLFIFYVLYRGQPFLYTI